MAVAYLMMALEHREAALLRVRQHAFGSALALARPAYEKCCRGLWAKLAATDDQIEALGTVRGAPKFETIAKQLAKSEEAKRLNLGLLAEVRFVAWDGLSDHAHGGRMHLHGWLSRDEIGPQFAPEQIANLLLLLDLYAYFAMFGVMACAGQDGAPANRVYEDLLRQRVAEVCAG